MRTIQVSDTTYESIKGQLGEKEKTDLGQLDDLIGKKFFFRTVTYHLCGKVVSRMGNFLKLENASWIGDSGRFSQAIKNVKFDEVEPVGEAFINLESVTDFFPLYGELPTEQK